MVIDDFPVNLTHHVERGAGGITRCSSDMLSRAGKNQTEGFRSTRNPSVTSPRNPTKLPPLY